MKAALSVEKVAGPAWWRQVREWIELYHRHHGPPRGWKYGLVAHREGNVVGVAVIGRPVARALNGAEITRLCTWGSSTARHGAASAMLRMAAMMEPEIVTYTLDYESGVSLLAAGWKCDKVVRAKSWSCKSRPRLPAAHESFDKRRWRPCIA